MTCLPLAGKCVSGSAARGRSGPLGRGAAASRLACRERGAEREPAREEMPARHVQGERVREEVHDPASGCESVAGSGSGTDRRSVSRVAAIIFCSTSAMILICRREAGPSRRVSEAGNEFARRREQSPEPYECPHDLDVDPHGDRRSQHAGEHRDAVLREGARVITTPAMACSLRSQFATSSP